MKLTPGVDFINIFMLSFYMPRSQKHKRQQSAQCIIVLVGSTCAKAACKMLVKLAPERRGGAESIYLHSVPRIVDLVSTLSIAHAPSCAC